MTFGLRVCKHKEAIIINLIRLIKLKHNRLDKSQLKVAVNIYCQITNLNYQLKPQHFHADSEVTADTEMDNTSPAIWANSG